MNYREIDSRMAIKAFIWFVILFFGACFSGIRFTYLKPIRLVAHAFAAIVIVNLLYNFFAVVLHLMQEYLELWIWMFIPNKFGRKILLDILRKMVVIAILVLPAIVYGLYCYCWEKCQAIDFNRNVQYYQLIVDYISICATSGWIFWNDAEGYKIRGYYMKNSRAKKKVKSLFYSLEQFYYCWISTEDYSKKVKKKLNNLNTLILGLIPVVEYVFLKLIVYFFQYLFQDLL